MYNKPIDAYLECNIDLFDFVTEADEAPTTNAGTIKQINPNAASNKTTGDTNTVAKNNPTKSDIKSSEEKKKVSDKVKDVGENISNRIDGIIKTIIGIIQELGLFVTNRLKLVLETEKGFNAELSKQRSLVKPKDNISVTCYEYNEDYLYTTIRKMTERVNKMIKALEDVETANPISDDMKKALGSEGDNMIATLLSEFSTSSKKPTTPREFVREMSAKYRGEKSTRTYSSNNINTFLQRNSQQKNVIDFINAKIRECNTSINNLKKLDRLAKSQGVTKEVRDMIIRNLNKAQTIYNVYNQIIRAYTELKIESILSNREILKRFYQFN